MTNHRFFHPLFAALLVVALAPPSHAASQPDRQARFAQLHQQTWVQESFAGRLEIYISQPGSPGAGQTQFRGLHEEGSYASEPGQGSGPGHALLERVGSGSTGVSRWLEFRDPTDGAVIRLVNRFPVGDRDPEELEFWNQLAPGSVVQGEDGPYIPTAVILVEGGRPEVAAAFAEEIPLR